MVRDSLGRRINVRPNDVIHQQTLEEFTRLIVAHYV